MKFFNSALPQKEQKLKREDALHGARFQNLYFLTSINSENNYTSTY
jgi:hypothetical protein